MTSPEIDTAIAQACGWKHVQNFRWEDPNGLSMYEWDLPNYCNDLNAMHEAEKVLLVKFEDYRKSSELWSNYQINLWIAGVAYRSYHATARQRAEAFLRTLGLWKEVLA